MLFLRHVSRAANFSLSAYFSSLSRHPTVRAETRPVRGLFSNLTAILAFLVVLIGASPGGQSVAQEKPAGAEQGSTASSRAGSVADRPSFAGQWQLKDELSGDPDAAVEEAIRASGGRVRRSFFGRAERGRYRGGPDEHALYDHITYDRFLHIEQEEPEFRFRYFEDAEAREAGRSYERVFHTDGRKRSVQASDLYSGGAGDFSFAEWDGNTLRVEARPRDEGYTLETYSLARNGEQLRAELTINPDSFGTPIRLTLVYERVGSGP